MGNIEPNCNGKNKDWSQITIHSTILQDRYKRLVKTDKIHTFFYIFRGDSLSMTVSRFPVPLICKISEQSDWLESVKEQLFWNMRVVQKKKEKTAGEEGGALEKGRTSSR